MSSPPFTELLRLTMPTYVLKNTLTGLLTSQTQADFLKTIFPNRINTLREHNSTSAQIFGPHGYFFSAALAFPHPSPPQETRHAYQDRDNEFGFTEVEKQPADEAEENESAAEKKSGAIVRFPLVSASVTALV